MARKATKSVKPLKKEISHGVSTKKGGKVIKKLPDSKSKKKVGSQIKQAVKSHAKIQKNEVKQISPANSRRSSRTNISATKKKSSTPVSHRASANKLTSSQKMPGSTRAAKVQGTGKRKISSTERPELKKHDSSMKATTASQKSIKNETLSSGSKQAGSRMSLRGNKRSYAQLASGIKIEDNNVTKKRKTLNTKKEETSRRSRSIKPTVKGSEWRNTILQKKSAGSKQDQSLKQAVKPRLKNTASAVSNKLSNQKKKTLSGKILQAKPVLNQRNVKRANKQSPRLKQQSGESKTSKKGQKKTSLTKVQKTTKIDAVAKKSQRSRSVGKKSATNQDENKVKASKTNSLATSIQDKFNSCVSRQRKTRGSDLQENVLIAQDILHGILKCVGASDTLVTDETTEYSEDVKSVNSESQIEPLNSFYEDGLSKNENTTNNDVTKETTNTAANEINVKSASVEKENPMIVTENTDDSTKESTCNKLDELRPASKEHGDVDISNVVTQSVTDVLHNKNEPATQEEDLTVEEMELNLSGSSVTSVTEIETESERSLVSNSDHVNKIVNHSLNESAGDQTDSKNILVSGLAPKEDLKLDEVKKEDQFIEELQKKQNVGTEEDKKMERIKKEEQVIEDLQKTQTSCTTEDGQNLEEVKKTLCATDGSISYHDTVSTLQTKKMESPIKNKVFLLKPEISADTVEVVDKNSECSMNLDSVNKKSSEEKDGDLIIDDNKEYNGSFKEINHTKNEKLQTDKNFNNSTNLSEEKMHKKEEISGLSLANEIEKKENAANCESKSDNVLNPILHQDANSDKNCEEIEQNLSQTSIKSVKTDIHSIAVKDEQSEPIHTTIIEQIKFQTLNNGSPVINGTGTSHEVSPQENEGMKCDSFQSLEERNIDKATISCDNEKVIVNKVHITDDLCFQNVTKKSDESSTFCSKAKLTSDSEDHSLKNEVQSDMKVARLQVELSNHCNQNEFKSKEIDSHGLRQSEKLESQEDTFSNIEKTNKILSNTETVCNDNNENSDKTISLDSIENKSIPQDVQKTCLDSKVDINLDSSVSGKLIYKTSQHNEVFKETSQVDESSKQCVDVQSKHSTTDFQRDIPSGVSAKENDITTSKIYNTIATNEIARSTNLTEEVKDITLESSNSSSQETHVSIDENQTVKNDHRSDCFPQQTLGEEEKPDSCERGGMLNSNNEIPANVIVEDSEIKEEFPKMEEAVQEETTQDSIIVDDTDVESMQCNSETHSSNRMSVDEETPTMEVDLEEGAVMDVNASITSENKIDTEITMEVS